MKPYYERGGVTIWNADCRDVLPAIEIGSVDLLLTDPPYGVAYSTGYRTGVCRSSTRLVNDLLTAPLLGDVAALTAPLLGDAGAVYWFSAPEQLDTVLPILRRHWQITNLLVWDKGNCTAGDLDTRYGEQWESIIFCRKQRVPLKGRRDRDVLRFSRGDTNAYLHPTQKPLPLLRFLIEKHNWERGSMLLDPFMGSGTALRAAKDMGWNAMGIEVEERFCEVAARRLEQEVLPLEVAG